MNIKNYDDTRYPRASIRWTDSDDTSTYNNMLVQSISGMSEKVSYKLYKGQYSDTPRYWIKKASDRPDIKNIYINIPLEEVNEFIGYYNNNWRVSKAIITGAINFSYKDTALIGYMVGITVREEYNKMASVEILFYTETISENPSNAPDEEEYYDFIRGLNYSKDSACTLTGQSKVVYDQFMLQSITRNYQEKFQLIQTGKENRVVAFGNNPSMINIQLYVPNISEKSDLSEEENILYSSYKKHIKEFIISLNDTGAENRRKIMLEYGNVYQYGYEENSTELSELANTPTPIEFRNIEGTYSDTVGPGDIIEIQGVLK